MDTSSIDPTLREWLFAREMMRRLGFSADDLFFVVHSKGGVIFDDAGREVEIHKPFLSLVLKAQGKEFHWTIGPTDIPDHAIMKAYEEVCEVWNSGPPELFDGFLNSRVFRQKVQLVTALHEKGFVVRQWN